MLVHQAQAVCGGLGPARGRLLRRGLGVVGLLGGHRASWGGPKLVGCGRAAARAGRLPWAVRPRRGAHGRGLPGPPVRAEGVVRGYSSMKNCSGLAGAGVL
ncbi:hypothetical protein GCM10009834_28980 [Streptomonospora arabica]|uniref:Uncharacterized protein n=1 Tax=Streptomonospora halophila TaxID=427369 RepID=A0ABP9GDG8_9ACTN